jgi:hypothetical protein
VERASISLCYNRVLFFLLLYEIVQFLKAKFNIKYRIEYSIVLLLIFAVTSNMIGLLI